MQSMASWHDSKDWIISTPQKSFTWVNLNTAMDEKVHNNEKINYKMRSCKQIWVVNTQKKKKNWERYSLCHVPQIISGISCCIYLLQQPRHCEWTVTVCRRHFVECLPRESSMNRNRSHLHLCALVTNLYKQLLSMSIPSSHVSQRRKIQTRKLC